MTSAAATADTANETAGRSATSDALKAMLASGSNSDALFMHLLDRSQLPSEQTDLLKMMIGAGAFADDGEAADPLDAEDWSDDEFDLEPEVSSFDSAFSDEDTDQKSEHFEEHEAEPEGDDADDEDGLVAVNDTLAAALGACRYCWGGDDECSACSGEGTPGSSDPDPTLFKQFVLPAVKRVRSGDRSARGPRQHSS